MALLHNDAMIGQATGPLADLASSPPTSLRKITKVTQQASLSPRKMMLPWPIKSFSQKKTRLHAP